MAYIGKSPTGTGVRSRYYFTATGGETSLSGADDNSNTLAFSDGKYVDVSLNGIALVAGTDYNTSTANTIGGLSALSASDIVEVVVYDIFTVADTVSAANGGTFSGNVAMGGTLSVTGASTATGGLNVGTIKDATGTTTAMTIDSTGRILTPARPAFCVQWSASQTGLSATGYNRLNFDTELFDVGSNLSGAVFTAPVSGIYQFNLSQRFDSIGTGYVIIGLADDGSTHNAASILWNTSYRIVGAPSSNFETLQSSITFELTAGDDVAPWYYNSSDTSYSLAVSGAQFSGFLVG